MFKWFIVLGALVVPQTGLGQFVKTFAVYKASYNKNGQAIGGIAGSAFFVSPNKALSAAHVMSPVLFRPAKGYQHVQVWLLNPSYGALEVTPAHTVARSDYDAAAIMFKHPVMTRPYIYSLQTRVRKIQPLTINGFRAGKAGVKLLWDGSRMRVLRIDSLPFISRTSAHARLRKVSISASDVKLHNKKTYHLPIGSVVGMSGGPTIMNGQVVGINSFGFPVRTLHKTTTFSVALTDSLISIGF